MAAFRAPEEPDLALICSPELTEPPDCKVVLALGALDLDRGHRLFLPFLFHNDDLIFTSVHRALHLVSSANLPDIPAFPAFQLAGR